ncbi:Gfo/Idh/MocA family protein [Polynucleobacter sp. IMCC 29146]|uniref:Gfo/Idh/MocA family protein n=1 Tax=Polynucleobacter sp. IMCC 29146 TaxID=2780953 RepID=UPI001F4032E2|nr:Gfo/Idh/MocA family oxidoreductase [Polynucleobacter sp. IMCC 29146]MCE7530601.1 Gfo/Idh/MocA family oxidoreductase [Polynucleobacter sp. IMCC 29146]
MRVIVVGLGVQGNKRQAVAGKDVVATVDPVHPQAQFKSIEEVPLESYDAALLCIPDEPKMAILEYLLSNKKHLLVEKPLFANRQEDLVRLQKLAQQNRVTCYTAYNHRFEPHFIRMKELIDSGRLGKIYSIRMYYGNGTARLVRDSAWRDQGAGVLPDLGSHLLDTLNFWLSKPIEGFKIFSANRFENRAFDQVSFGANADPIVQLEVSLLSWRNHFYADIYAEKGTAHIQSLCKWGPSTFTFRDRKLPSGRPDEESVTLVQLDSTWELEYEHFKKICLEGSGNIENDIWINRTLGNLSSSLNTSL